MEKSYGSMGTRVGEITTVGISDTIRTDLGIKGGGLPQFQLPDVADVEFVYLLNPNITVTAAPAFPVRTAAVDVGVVLAAGAATIVNGTAVAVPDGANKLSFTIKRTTAAAITGINVWVEGSNDNITWFDTTVAGGQTGGILYVANAVGPGSLQNASYTYPNHGNGPSGTFSSTNNAALPKYVRLGMINNDVAVSATVDVMLVVA